MTRLAVCALLTTTAAICGGVDNPIEPSGKPMTLRLTEDLRFGADENDENYLWANPATLISVDKRGHMFVADPEDCRVLEYDSGGKYIRTIATEGKGPNQFEYLFNYTILADGSAVGTNSRGGTTAKFFDTDHNYTGSKVLNSPGRSVFYAIPSPTGKSYAVLFKESKAENPVSKLKTGLIDTDLNLIHQFSAVDQMTFNPGRMEDPVYMGEFLTDQLKAFFGPIGVFNYDAEGRLYSAVSTEYSITRWSADGKTKELVINRKYKPVANDAAHRRALVEGLVEEYREIPVLARVFSESVVQRSVERAELAPVKNPVFGLIPMEKGRLLVVHDIDMASGKSRGDLFNADGVYLGWVELPDHGMMTHFSGLFYPRLVFRNGFAYTLHTDTDGDNQVVRYRYAIEPR
ncbi:MAG: hypothetical protein QNK37_01960 [Acidobacteriota bacterium]|nr:hypothetical protein [Acidobacteriota bacterium]